jgi:ABC-type Fe3+-siderophore transport system permease subunit
MPGRGPDGSQSPPRTLAIAAVVCALAAILILVIPFIGVFVSAVLGPLAVVLGAVAVKRAGPGIPHRRLALAGLALGVAAMALLTAFLATGFYSEYAR